MSASFSGPEAEHTNLSALRVIGSSVSSLLGPIKGVKCLFDEESNEGVLVTSTNELLQCLDIEHPVGQLAREYCLSQHKQHGSGCTTLVTLAGLWAANVQSLLNQDVPIQDIIHIGDEFLQECKDIAEQSTVSIHCLSKPATATAEKGKGRDSMLCSSSTLLQIVNAAKGMESLSLNSNSNNNCALPSQVSLKSTTHSESNVDENWKHTVTSNFESTVSCPEQEHTSPAPIASSVILDTSSAVLEDDDDVSWFFENDSQYSDKAEDTNSSNGGQLAAKLQEFSLHEHKQKKSNHEKLMGEQDGDVEWFFEEDEDIDRMCSGSHSALHRHSDDSESTISSPTYEQKRKDIGLKLTGLKESVEQDMKEAGESISKLLPGPQTLPSHQDREESEPAMCKKGVYSLLKQRQCFTTEVNSSPRTFTLKSNDHFESLIKSAIEQKPSKLLKGSHRILSRHLVAYKQDIDTLCPTSEPSKNKGKLAVTSIDCGQDHFEDEKASFIPTLTQRQRTSDSVLTQCDVKSFELLSHNVDVTRILVEEPTMKAEESQTIATLGNNLSHGAVAEMKLAIEACQMQLNASQEHCRSAFSPGLVHIQTVTGPPSLSSCCISGLVLPIHENQLNTLHKRAGESMAALLLNSDLQESYRHRGFKDSLKSSSIVSGIPTPGTTPNSLWTERILSSLQQLNVSLLLVRGSVDSSLVDACCFHNILILEHVPYRLMQLLATVYKSNLLIYTPDALQDDVCENIKVSYWSSGYEPHPTVRRRDLNIQHHVRIVCPGNVITIVLCAPSEPHLLGAEQRLHSCMARLRWALHDGKVLPGGGRIEQHLVDKLSQQNGSITDFQRYRHGLVYDALSQGFRSYIQHVHLNLGQHQPSEDAIPDAVGFHSSPSSNVHDCLSAKIGAWQRAWHLVKQVLLCDALIITGVGEGDDHLERVL